MNDWYRDYNTEGRRVFAIMQDLFQFNFIGDASAVAPVRPDKMPIEIPDVGREDLARLFYELGYTVGAEIGVEDGIYSEVICKANPDLMRLYCVDAWQAYSGYREHVTQEKLDAIYERAKERLAPYPTVLRKQYSTEAAIDLESNSLDFVYLDANHTLPQVIADLEYWIPNVRKGGIIAGHDYCKRASNGYNVHVMEAVQAWTQAYHIRPWFVIGSKEIRPGEHRDRPRSWMWVKQ